MMSAVRWSDSTANTTDGCFLCGAGTAEFGSPEAKGSPFAAFFSFIFCAAFEAAKWTATP